MTADSTWNAHNPSDFATDAGKTLLNAAALGGEHAVSNATLLVNGALSADHPPASQTLLIQSAVPSDRPPVNVYALLDQAIAECDANPNGGESWEKVRTRILASRK